eukprot:NODE_1688_length_1332_cov_7.430242_g1402_i0.p1 GENE.NODE_1688_length_1332_cov_7.430242_g1402_i0~~NODE_1688_length_1332_cov_7.430242_g1402_i0.p1  ORF type:complete len:434 (+),score=98.01 NODE_1688_length_1332_cov_7.430242_g1402_i0:196-1302(+)
MVTLAPRWGAELLLALEHLHGCGVIHRDLKPENCLLTSDLHLKLADFGSYSLMDDPKDLTSFKGTPEYLAPELLGSAAAKLPCSPAADLWAFGCVIYYLFAGEPPFGECAEGFGQIVVWDKIRALDYCCPPSMPPAAKDLVASLLVLDPTVRPSIPNLKRHAFFKGIDWGAGPNGLLQLENRTALNTDYTSLWSDYLLESEEAVFASAVIKTRHFTKKRRVLILTDYPRLIYVDPGRNCIKGQISFPGLTGSSDAFRRSFQRNDSLCSFSSESSSVMSSSCSSLPGSASGTTPPLPNASFKARYFGIPPPKSPLTRSGEASRVWAQCSAGSNREFLVFTQKRVYQFEDLSSMGPLWVRKINEAAQITV